MANDRRLGVLLVNLGTPASPAPADVRRYLHEFLSDPRVIDTNPLLRGLLLYGAVLPFRPRTSAAAYAKIWRDDGSPLLAHGRALAGALARELGSSFQVELAMRYGEPSIERALEALADTEALIVAPLFPQYASSSTGSALERIYAEAGKRWNVSALRVLEPFYSDPGFIAAQVELARPLARELRPDHVLFSFHGLPERQVKKSDPSGAHCLAKDDCCASMGPANRWCYRAQCHETARLLGARLELDGAQWSVSFQSRLGRTPWIRPFTDHVLPELARKGVRRLLIACPSFVADCLETLEEIGIRARAQWSELGGEALGLVPCVNAHPTWVGALARMVRATD
jgi:ferrochelatase